MKKLICEECEQISISAIVRKQKSAMFKLQSRWNRQEFYCVLADRLGYMVLLSVRKPSPLDLSFTFSTPHFGGQRYWFLCPHCGKRVGKLYRPRLTDKFECRHCHRLTYASSQVHNRSYRKPLPFPPPYWVRKQGEQRAYDKYVLPLLES
jgi:hypothetical protein